jgi:hypothetical protein
VVCTAYSSVGADALELGRLSGGILASVLYVMGRDVARDFAAYAGFSELPPVRRGLALAVSDDPKEIVAGLSKSLSPVFRAAVSKQIQSEWSDHADAADIILDTIFEDHARAVQTNKPAAVL